MEDHPFRLGKNKTKDQCPVYRCKKLKGNKKGFCHRHHAQAVKHRHPVSCTYNTLKQNAKRRGIGFDLTLKQFREWVKGNGYMEGKGKEASSLSIDRIDSSIGYELGNLQLLTLSDNTKKMHLDNRSEEPPF